MSGRFVAASVLIAAYLLVQAIEDARTKTVFVTLNNLMICIVSALYLIKCADIRTFPSLLVPLVSVAVIASYKWIFGRIMGIGDTKAYIVIFMQSGLFFEKDVSYFLLFPLFVMFFANLLFSVWVIGSGVANGKKGKEIFFSKERRAFFPFLLVGYIATFTLAVSFPTFVCLGA